MILSFIKLYQTGTWCSLLQASYLSSSEHSDTLSSCDLQMMILSPTVGAWTSTTTTYCSYKWRAVYLICWRSSIVATDLKDLNTLIKILHKLKTQRATMNICNTTQWFSNSGPQICWNTNHHRSSVLNTALTISNESLKDFNHDD